MDVHGQHQQAILRRSGEVGLQEGELRFTQAADVLGLLVWQVDDIVEHDEVGLRFFPGIGVRAECMAEAVERLFVARRVEIDVVVAGRV